MTFVDNCLTNQLLWQGMFKFFCHNAYRISSILNYDVLVQYFVGVLCQHLSAEIDAHQTQATQLSSQLRDRYFVSHTETVIYPPELHQPVEDLRAITAALPDAVEAKRRALDTVQCAAADFAAAAEDAESLLKSVDDSDANKRPFGTASEQLSEQKVGSSCRF